MVKEPTRLEVDKKIPDTCLSSRPFSIQVIFKGLSPFETVHCTEMVSPELMSSSPKVNGNICGATVFLLKYKKEC